MPLGTICTYILNINNLVECVTGFLSIKGHTKRQKAKDTISQRQRVMSNIENTILA